MSNRPNTSKQRRPAQTSVTAARGGGGPSRLVWIIGGAAIVVVAALLAAVLARGSSSPSIPTGADAAAIVKKATAVPETVYDDVGVGTAAGSLQALPGDIRTGKDGKPDLLYIGAEYCPFCAAERWAVAAALSRFGTFSDLGLTRSSSSDSYPDTPSLSFHGSTYTSKYLTFTGVETQTNERSADGGYEPLDTPTPAQLKVQAASGSTSIPFFDIGGRYVSSGASYSPDVLQGESFAQVADALRDPDTDVAKGAIGSANVFTAMICNLTDDQPGAVCNSVGVKAASSKVPRG